MENQAPTSCRLGPILSSSITSCELHAKMAEETELETAFFGTSEARDLGSGPGHIGAHMWLRSTHTSN